jgi:hypothetical protein
MNPIDRRPLTALALLLALAGCASNRSAPPTPGETPQATPESSRATGSGAAAIRAGPGPGEGGLSSVPSRRTTPSLEEELRAREQREVSAFRKRNAMEELPKADPPAWFEAGPKRDGPDLLVPGTGSAPTLADAYRRAIDDGTRATVEIPRAALPDSTPAKAAFARPAIGGYRVWVLMRTRAPGEGQPPSGPAPVIDLSGSTPKEPAVSLSPESTTPATKTPAPAPATPTPAKPPPTAPPPTPPSPTVAGQNPDWWFEGVKDENGERLACAKADRAELRAAVRDAVDAARKALTDAGATNAASADADRTTSAKLDDGTYRAFVLVRVKK